MVTLTQRQQGDSPDSVHSENIWEIQNSFSGFKCSLVLQEFFFYIYLHEMLSYGALCREHETDAVPDYF